MNRTLIGGSPLKCPGPCITNVFATSQEFQPMASQLSKKAALPLAKILATCRNNVSNTGPSDSKSVPLSWYCHNIFGCETETISQKDGPSGKCGNLCIYIALYLIIRGSILALEVQQHLARISMTSSGHIWDTGSRRLSETWRKHG